MANECKKKMYGCINPVGPLLKYRLCCSTNKPYDSVPHPHEHRYAALRVFNYHTSSRTGAWIPRCYSSCRKHYNCYFRWSHLTQYNGEKHTLDCFPAMPWSAFVDHRLR